MYDAVVIGAGVVGCAIAQRLAEYQGRFAVVDRADDVSQGASKANSGIVHTGYDAAPGSKKARMNVRGARMYPAYCAKFGVSYEQPGALVIGFDEEDRATLEGLLKRAEQNEVGGCSIIEREKILAMEPSLNPEVLCALYVPDSGLVSPYELTCALADSAAENGVDFLLNCAVTGLSRQDGHWLVKTGRDMLEARAVINCAGTGGGDLHNMISTRKVTIIPRRGQYYLLDHEVPLRFNMTIFQVPTKMGKGVLVTPTTHGNLLIGPTAEDIPDKDDTATTRDGLAEALVKARLSWPGLGTRTVITTFSGIRAHEKGGDFIIGAVEGAPDGAFEAIGIESPGLTAAPAIGEEVGDQVARWLQLDSNPAYKQPTPLPKPFNLMSPEERIRAFDNNPDYGRIVCRCERVTEAEVRHAIKRPVGAKSVDGVKRRTRAGMGRCQGGFCSPRVMQILAEELGVHPTQVTKSGAGSAILTGALGIQEEQADG